MFEDLVDYVRENYSRASKIVELGVGSRIDVAEKIKKQLQMAEVLVTDRDEASVRKHATRRVRAVADDLMFTQKSLYRNASLLYSINPPFVLLAQMVALAGSIG